jgi:hypothetical protein
LIHVKIIRELIRGIKINGEALALNLSQDRSDRAQTKDV